MSNSAWGVIMAIVICTMVLLEWTSDCQFVEIIEHLERLEPATDTVVWLCGPIYSGQRYQDACSNTRDSLQASGFPVPPSINPDTIRWEEYLSPSGPRTTLEEYLNSPDPAPHLTDEEIHANLERGIRTQIGPNTCVGLYSNYQRFTYECAQVDSSPEPSP